MTIYTECCILPHHVGFGEYQRGELQFGPETSYADLGQLEREGGLTPLENALTDEEFVAAGIRDIRGRIHNQPTRIYARINYAFHEGPSVDYFGVESSEVSENFFN